MRKYVYIGAGGAAGAILRYLISGADIGRIANLPANTLLINVAGCFLLAFILTLNLENKAFSPNLSLGMATGFLGAFTTFSTVCRQTLDLMANGDYFSAANYIIVSGALGFSAAGLGFVLAKKLQTKKANKESFAMLEEEEQ
jgi:CrcB protein